MSKERSLPVYRLGDTEFLVDVERLELRQADRPENIISFLEMEDMQTHYQLPYDRATRTFAVLDHPFVQLEAVPPLVKLDPEGMSLKYGVPVAELVGKTDWQVMVDADLLQQRRLGELPRLQIAGEDYIVDIRLHELRHARDFAPQINLKRLALSADGMSYEAYYSPVIRQVVELDPGLTEFPDHVVKIVIPNELRLDPVGAAGLYGLEEKDLIRLYPLKAGRQAGLIPLSETTVPSLIQRNREQLLQEHQEIARKFKPRHRL
jgi:hypothetical protein